MTDNPNAFKHWLDPVAVRRLGRVIEAAEPTFARTRFERAATRGLTDLELKARVKHIIAALKASLPEDPKVAVAALVRARAPFEADGELKAMAAWPIIDFVGAHGLEDFDGSMAALRQLTPLFSAEFSIRPFIVKDPERALAIMSTWREHEDEHVRRLVSEGSRPRLPWGLRLDAFVKDPRPVLALIDGLKDDPAEYVRRSVANHLNDITKDHPRQALETARRWSKGASPERQWVVKHATRGLVKAGDPDALALLGFDPKAKLEVRDFALERETAAVGDKLPFGFEIRSRAKTVQPLVIDYAVHHVKKDGRRTAKVFKLKTVELGPGERLRVDKKHSLAKVTTRVYYPGRHAIELRINGRSRGMKEFDLVV